MLAEKYDPLSVQRLVKRGYFEKWDTVNGRPGGTTAARIGLIVVDDARGTMQIPSITRQLATYGLKPFTVQRCSSAVDAAVTCQQSTVLRFQSDKVTHLFGANLTFMQQAESQRYRPRHFIAFEPALYAKNCQEPSWSGR